jgi:hypothetical protein
MQEEYNGKSIFSQRYIGMTEEAIRNEMDRLQNQVYMMEKVLDSLNEDGKMYKQTFEANQRKGERLIRGMDEKLSKVQKAVDYTSLQDHVDEMIKNISADLEDRNKGNFKKVMVMLRINTILLIILIALIAFTHF